MKLTIAFLLAAVVSLILIIVGGCTQQERAKNYGGTLTVQLKPNRKLVNATWKKDDLWLLTKTMTKDDEPETYQFIEDSSYGVWEGTVTIKENKQ